MFTFNIKFESDENFENLKKFIEKILKKIRKII